LRSDLKPGDIGAVVSLHGTLYAAEYHLDHTFEGYVAAGVAEFAISYNPDKDRLWIAEMDGKMVGCIAIVGRPDAQAQLRWFLVHPDSRGQGLGGRLLSEAIQFCRQHGFKSIYLWTISNLKSAAHLYQSAGFDQTEEKTHELWGQMLTEERYDLSL
jgi:N-acetylglutamate synthase-like GNAT family acetyltransferase